MIQPVGATMFESVDDGEMNRIIIFVIVAVLCLFASIAVSYILINHGRNSAREEEHCGSTREPRPTSETSPKK